VLTRVARQQPYVACRESSDGHCPVNDLIVGKRQAYVPGGIQDHLHDDLAAGFARLRVVLPGVQDSVRVAVQDAVKETERVRGSHTDTGHVTVPAGHIDPPGAITPDLGPHDVMLFENRLWHAGGLNTSGRPRLAAMMQYGYRWLAPIDDPAPELLEREGLNDIERQLLGWPDRHPDGSIAHEGAGAAPLRTWWEHLTPHPARFPE
jgi:ectoine hydroxylase-related dioxygenase (phytanoyl-CoA dioxygenase family)